MNVGRFSPIFDHIILGGGIDKKLVANTDISQTKFNVHFFDVATEQTFSNIPGHFGPINTLAFHPSGKGYFYFLI